MIGLKVADGAIPTCHAEPLDEQVWGGEREYSGDAVSTLRASEWSLHLQ